MGVMDFIKGQLIDVIEFKTDDKDILVHKFEDNGKQIMMGAMLTVRPGQKAVFVNEGQIADVFSEGLHKLSTSNMPVLTKLRSWKYGFESPFKVDIYFFSVDDKIQQQWGTPNKIAVKDEEFGIIRIGANAYYSYRIVDPETVLKKLVGTDEEFTVSECKPQLNGYLTTSFTGFFADSKVTLYEAYANVKEFSEQVYEDVKDKFAEYGLELIQFNLRQISIPESVEEAMDSRAQIGALGGIDMYTRKTMTDAMAKSALAAAQNEGAGGNMAGMGMQIGAGAAMGTTMAGMMQSALGAFQAGAQGVSGALTQAQEGAQADSALAAAAAASVILCANCKAQISSQAKFCPDCGSKQEAKEKFCADCGTKQEVGAKFCRECGKQQ